MSCYNFAFLLLLWLTIFLNFSFGFRVKRDDMEDIEDIAHKLGINRQWNYIAGGNENTKFIYRHNTLEPAPLHRPNHKPPFKALASVLTFEIEKPKKQDTQNT